MEETSNLNNNKSTKELNYRFICQACGKRFHRNDRLAQHVRVHTHEKPYECDICGAKYGRSQHLKRHVANTHGDAASTPASCSDCGKEFSSSWNLKKHVKRFHEAVKLHKCSCCEEQFAKKHQLNSHRTQVHGESPHERYKCPQCGKAFMFPNKLKRHLKVHQGYACSAAGCEHISSTMSALRHHIAETHKKSHVCQECGMIFKHRGNFRAHQLIHKELRSAWQCGRCSRTYFRRTSLLLHIRTFHNALRYRCNCGKDFVSRAGLVRHRLVHDIPVNENSIPGRD